MDWYNKDRSKIMDAAEASFTRNFESINTEISNLLIDGIYGMNISSNKFTNSPADALKNKNKLIKLRTELRKLLSNGEYSSKVNSLLKDLDKLEVLNASIQYEVNGLTVSKKVLTKGQNIAVDVVTSKMTTDIDSSFIQPLSRALYNNIALGTNVQQTEEFIRNYVMGNTEKQGMLERYAGQMAIDSISQYDGIINQVILNEYDFDRLMYVGSIIKDSRPQCIRWVEKSEILLEELQDEIDWAKEYGTGMIEDTTVDNFCSVRGGYRCRHAAIPTNKK
jgi:hypothetical protein